MIKVTSLFCTLLLIFSPFIGAETFTNIKISNKSDIKTITLPLSNWTSQRVITRALSNILEKKNVPTKLIELTTENQWGALRKGIIHFQVEVWQPSMAKPFYEMLKLGHIEDLGTHDAIVREDWWYPKYVEEQCPSLPNWQALTECISLFSDGNKGVYYNGPWQYNDADTIRSLGLHYKIVYLKSEQALWQKLEEAYLKKKPIVMLNWTPNWTDVRIEGHFINFPEYTKACETNPEWGINPSLAFDCGNPKNGWLKKAASPKLANLNPCVYEFFKAINLNNKMIAEASALVIADQLTEVAAAFSWQTKFKQDIAQWSKKANCF